MRDMVRTFVKFEPHLEEKILEGRLRLIFNTGATDIGIERWLFSSVVGRMIRHHADSPFKPCMGLHDEGIEELMRWFKL